MLINHLTDPTVYGFQIEAKVLSLFLHSFSIHANLVLTLRLYASTLLVLYSYKD